MKATVDNEGAGGMGEIDADDSTEVKLIKRMSVKFSRAVSVVDQGEAFELIKKLSNYL